MIPLGKATIQGKLAAFAFLISILPFASCCYGSDFVFIRSNLGASAAQDEMQKAADFYGLGLRVVTAGPGTGGFSIRTAVEELQTVGVVIDADALSAVDENMLLGALKRNRSGEIPLLILGAGPDLSPALAKAWSGGEATGCTQVDSSSNAKYSFGRIDGMTRQLAGVEAPFPGKGASYFAWRDTGAAQRIESVRDGSNTSPVFIESAIGRQIVFLACSAPDAAQVSAGKNVVSEFLRMAPAMIFVRYCAGERAWHSLNYYANFTIDDPWLREPYGYVSYEGLLGEMEQHNFHTTIAFIPWNYERSQPGVVSLFRNHPDRFSISVHGNDHDHKEFTDLRTKPLAVQVGDIKQALARMDRFQAITGIPYDKAMIFPHSIAPAGTLGALKTYNYLATVNSVNVPQDAAGPAKALDVLRPVTLAYEGFPSIFRFPAELEVPEAYVAINEFLGNPLFFYDHSDLFSKGIGAFDHVADEVNRLEPATKWRSLGEIVKNLYVVKLRDDSNYDVLSYSNNVCLENPAGRSSTFFLQKPESGGQAIASVSVDRKDHPYTLQDGILSLSVPIAMGATRCVAIRYANDLQSNPANPAHDSVIVDLLRWGSDFRDIYLAKSSAGLATIAFYNEHNLTPLEVIACLLLMLTAVIYAAYRLRRSAKRRRGSSRAVGASSRTEPPPHETLDAKAAEHSIAKV